MGMMVGEKVENVNKWSASYRIWKMCFSGLEEFTTELGRYMIKEDF